MLVLLDLLYVYGLVCEWWGFGMWCWLEGLMIGKIDFIYVCDGCWYVFDYKFNWLFGYDLVWLVIVM